MSINVTTQAHQVVGLNRAPIDSFGGIAHRLGVTPHVVHIEKQAEVYWEDGPADHVYQLVSGAV